MPLLMLPALQSIIGASVHRESAYYIIVECVLCAVESFAYLVRTEPAHYSMPLGALASVRTHVLASTIIIPLLAHLFARLLMLTRTHDLCGLHAIDCMPSVRSHSGEFSSMRATAQTNDHVRRSALLTYATVFIFALFICSPIIILMRRLRSACAPVVLCVHAACTHVHVLAGGAGRCDWQAGAD